jgi:hypothetical protein
LAGIHAGLLISRTCQRVIFRSIALQAIFLPGDSPVIRQGIRRRWMKSFTNAPRISLGIGSNRPFPIRIRSPRALTSRRIIKQATDQTAQAPCFGSGVGFSRRAAFLNDRRLVHDRCRVTGVSSSGISPQGISPQGILPWIKAVAERPSPKRL